MYIYFDKYGALKEIINENAVRLGTTQNDIYAYCENENITGAFITIESDDFTSNELSMTKVTDVEIPYSKTRDLKYFKDFTKYDFYKIGFSSVGLSSGLARATIRLNVGGQLLAQGMVTFNVENSVIKLDHKITQSQYDYLISIVGAEKSTLDAHVANKNNPHEVTKEQLGLENVDNTSDLDKPISAATQAELTSLGNRIEQAETTLETHGNTLISHSSSIDAIEDDVEDIETRVESLESGSGGLAVHIADKNNPHNVTKAQIGLGNVNNTSDLDKPISRAVSEALEAIELKQENIHTDMNREIGAINALIPSGTTSSNKLVNESIVNQKIATAEAVFVGTFNSLEELQAYTGKHDKNDYAFVHSGSYKRYTYNGSSWLFEYQIDQVTFSTSQWNAINSGITSSMVQLLGNFTIVNGELCEVTED